MDSKWKIEPWTVIIWVVGFIVIGFWTSWKEAIGLVLFLFCLRAIESEVREIVREETQKVVRQEIERVFPRT